MILPRLKCRVWYTDDMTLFGKLFGGNSTDSTIITQYEPPNELTAPELGLLFDGRSGRLELLSALYQFKVSKIINIYKDNNDVTTLSLLRYPVPEITNCEDMLLRYFFNQERTVALSNFFSREDYGILQTYFNYMLLQSLQEKNIIVLEISTIDMSYVNYLEMLAKDPSLVTKEIMAALRPRKLTESGKSLMPGLEGFKQYLETAEIEKIKFHATGDLQNYIEKLTPYAIALGMAERWRLISTPLVAVLDETTENSAETTQLSRTNDYFNSFGEIANKIDSMQVTDAT